MASSFFVTIGNGLAHLGACIGAGTCAVVGASTAPSPFAGALFPGGAAPRDGDRRYWIGAAAGGACCVCGAVACARRRPDVVPAAGTARRPA